MIPSFVMICVPKTPSFGPDGVPHNYEPYEVAWDGHNRVIVSLVGGDGPGNAAAVERLSGRVALMRNPTYTCRLDFQRGTASFSYGRIDQCVVKVAPKPH